MSENVVNVVYQEHLHIQGGTDVESTSFWSLQGGEFLSRMKNEMIFWVAHDRSKIRPMAVFLNEASFEEGRKGLPRVVRCEPDACDLNRVRSLQFAGRGASKASNFMIVPFA